LTWPPPCSLDRLAEFSISGRHVGRLTRLLQCKITSPYKSMSYDITYRAWHYATGSDYLDED
jgi:hypothetical protein